MNTNTVNNNTNSVISILNVHLDKDVSYETKNYLATQIVQHFDSMNKKLDNLQDNKALVDYLLKQIDNAQKTNETLKEQLEKSERERKEQFGKIEQLQQENNDSEFEDILQRAKEALENYDSDKYQEILDEYLELQKNRQVVKNIANVHYLKAMQYHSDLKYFDAMQNIKKALVLEEDNSDYNFWYAYISNTIANYGEALRYFQKALEIQNNLPLRDETELARLYSNIGVAYDNIGNYKQALEYYQKSLAIKEKVLGKEHPSTAISYNNIGLVYHSIGDYQIALEYYKKALAINEKVLGKEHPSTASSYNNLGELYQNMKYYTKALKYHRQALAINEKVLGKEHPSTAISYNNIAVLYFNTTDYPKALEFMQKAVDIRQKVLPPNHPNLIDSKKGLEIIKSKMNL